MKKTKNLLKVERRSLEVGNNDHEDKLKAT